MTESDSAQFDDWASLMIGSSRVREAFKLAAEGMGLSAYQVAIAGAALMFAEADPELRSRCCLRASAAFGLEPAILAGQPEAEGFYRHVLKEWGDVDASAIPHFHTDEKSRVQQRLVQMMESYRNEPPPESPG